MVASKLTWLTCNVEDYLTIDKIVITSRLQEAVDYLYDKWKSCNPNIIFHKYQVKETSYGTLEKGHYIGEVYV